MFHSHLNISALNTAIKLLLISITTAVKNVKEGLLVRHSVTQAQEVPIVPGSIRCYEIYLIVLYCPENRCSPVKESLCYLLLCYGQ